MTKEELWNAFLDRYPQFKDDESIVKQTSRGLRRMIDQAWDEGHAKGVANGRALEARESAARASKDPFSGFFR
jgi:hypothetical protein